MPAGGPLTTMSACPVSMDAMVVAMGDVSPSGGAPGRFGATLEAALEALFAGRVVRPFSVPRRYWAPATSELVWAAAPPGPGVGCCGTFGV
jgi:hypothetical protein